MPIDAAAGRPRHARIARHRPDEPGRRSEIARLLRGEARAMSVAEIAERLGVHANTVRFHLETLVGNGQVECTAVRSGTRGRPRQLYRAVQGMDPHGPRRYQELAEVLVASVAADSQPGRRALEAGRAWGRRASTALVPTARDSTGPADPTERAEPAGADAAIERLTRLLDELGFAPEPQRAPEGGRRQIGLRHCPFLELSQSSSEVVCPVHLGLMQGAMESWRSPVTVDRLEAFVEPDRCLVHLSAGGAS